MGGMEREPGWYWWREHGEDHWQVVDVDPTYGVAFSGTDIGESIEWCTATGEWGPRIVSPGEAVAIYLPPTTTR